MKETIIQAITSRRLLSFQYDNQPRVVEPHMLGTSTAGNLTLSAYQVAGGSNSCTIPAWRPFLLHKISGLSIVEQTFSGVRDKYNPNTKSMTNILAKL